VQHIGEIVMQTMDKTRNQSRRLKAIPFMTHIPVWAMRKTLEKLPEDAYLVGSGQDIERNLHLLYVWSSEFEEVPFACRLPEIYITIHTKEQEVALEYER
jgi:hypothetical protein